jgi:hypothetical protein
LSSPMTVPGLEPGKSQKERDQGETLQGLKALWSRLFRALKALGSFWASTVS